MNKTSYRLIETLAGQGRIFENDALIYEVHYQLNVIRMVTTTEPFGRPAEEVLGDIEVKGWIIGRNDWSLINDGKVRVLELADHSRLEFVLEDATTGRIRGTADLHGR